MDSVDHKVLKTARQWHTDGRHVTLATITRSWGAASPSTGSMLAVRDDGQTMGSMSEGRVKHELIRHAHKTPPRSKVKVVPARWKRCWNQCPRSTGSTKFWRP